MKPAFSALTICGLEELEAHAARDVTHVLSIIDPGRDEPDVFRHYGAIQRTTLRFHDAIEPGPELIFPQSRTSKPSWPGGASPTREAPPGTATVVAEAMQRWTAICWSIATWASPARRPR